MLHTENTNSGIYKITNLIDGKLYVGSAVHFKKRVNVHNRAFKKGTNSKHLQRAWNLHGEENFVFDVLEEVPRLLNESDVEFKLRLVEDREQYYNDFFESYKRDKGYCLQKKCGSSLGIIRSDEFKEKIRQANLGRKESVETRTKKSELRKGIDNLKGIHPTGSESPLSVKVIQYSKEGIFIKLWDSISEAVQRYGFKSHTGIVMCCQMAERSEAGGYNTAGGYMWRYLSTFDYPYPSIIEQAIAPGKTFKDNYGIGTDKHDELLEKRKQTSNTNHGVSHHMKLDSHKKFGDLNPMKDEEIKKKVGKSGSNTKALNLVASLPEGHKFKELIEDVYTIECPLCNHNFLIGRPLLHLRKRENRVICTECNPLKKNQHK